MEPDQPTAPVADAGATPPAPQQRQGLSPEEQQASPEEQQLYEQFVAKGMMLVYDKAMFPKVIDLLEGEGDPIEGLARAASLVISRMMSLAEDAGQDLPGDVLFHGGKELFEDLAELSRRAGIKDFSADEDAFEGAYFRALDQLRIVLEGSGDINREAAQADLAMLQQMDEAGELESLFRDLASRDSAPADEPEEPATDPKSQAAPAPESEAPARGGGLMPKGNI